MLKSGLKDISVNKGESLSVPIVFTADPKPEITLLKDGKPIELNDNVRLDITEKELEHGLKEFKCVLNIKEGGYPKIQIGCVYI